jgi:hypothetical protein
MGDTAVVTSYLQIIIPETAAEPIEVPGHGSTRGFRLHRVFANRWELVRTPEGWEIERRFARRIGLEAARELLARGLDANGNGHSLNLAQSAQGE